MLEEIKKNISLFENGAENCTPEIVLLVGNGAIEGNSWEPVKKTKESYSQNFFLKFPDRKNIYTSFTNFDDAFFLAKLAFHKRTCSIRLRKNRSDADAIQTIEDIEKTRIVLGKNYQEIIGQLNLRSLPNKINNWLKEYVQKKEVGIITTNWEPSIKKLELPTIFLHGKVTAPTSILLPTEISHDFNDEVHLPANLKTMNWLEKAKHLIIWGVAFHEYDVEVSNVLMISEPEENHTRTLTIINPSLLERNRAIALAHLQKAPLILIERDIITSNKEFF